MCIVTQQQKPLLHAHELFRNSIREIYINFEWILSLLLLLLKEQLVIQQNGGPRKVVMQLLSEKNPKN